MPAIQPVPTFATVGPISPSATMTRVQPVKPRRPIPKFQTSMSLSAQFLNRITRSPSKSPFISTTASIRHHAWFRAIHPHSAMMKNWDVLSIALIVFTAVVTPFETAFAVATVDSFLFVLNRIVDICFFADAILHFFVMYYDEANSVWVSDRRKITWKYLTGWFLLDLISMLPFDVVGLAVDNNTVKQLRFTRVLRLLRLMKILKVLRGANNFRIWESKMSINYATIALVKFCLLVFMSSHWMACIFRMVVDIEEFVDPLGFKFNWMTEHTMGSIPISKSSLGIQYMSALYWSVMTLTTIGYGDLVPTTPGERSLAITCMLIGGGTYAYVVGSVCQILNSMDASTTEFHQTIDTLNEYCHHNQLPSELSARLREYFHSSRTLLRERQHHNLLLTMSPGLRGEVALYNNQWIAKIEFFNCSNDFERNQFITAVALLLRHECFPPNEYVIREGEFNTKMYLVQRGLATKGKVMYTGGTFFGEDIILTLRQRKIAVRAFSYLHVQALSKFELEELIYSGLYPEIQRNIRRQVLKTAFKNNFVKLSQDTIRRRNSNYRMRNSVSSNMPPMMVHIRNSFVEPTNMNTKSPMLRSTLGLNVPIGFYHDFLPKQSPPPAKLEKDDDTVDNIVEGVSNLMDANIAKFDEGLTKKIDQVLAQLERLEKYVAPNVIFSPAPAKTSTPPSTSQLVRQNSTAYLEAVQQLERGEIRSLVRANSNRRRSSLPSQIY